jgi:hypothetical protein
MKSEQIIVHAEWRGDHLVVVFADDCRAIVPATSIGPDPPTSLLVSMRPFYGVHLRYGRKRKSEFLPWDWLRHFGDPMFIDRTMRTVAVLDRA